MGVAGENGDLLYPSSKAPYNQWLMIFVVYRGLFFLLGNHFTFQKVNCILSILYLINEIFY